MNLTRATRLFAPILLFALTFSACGGPPSAAVSSTTALGEAIAAAKDVRNAQRHTVIAREEAEATAATDDVVERERLYNAGIAPLEVLTNAIHGAEVVWLELAQAIIDWEEGAESGELDWQHLAPCGLAHLVDIVRSLRELELTPPPLLQTAVDELAVFASSGCRRSPDDPEPGGVS